MTGLPDTYFVYPRHIVGCGLGITRQMLRTVEQCGVLKRSNAPAFRHMRVKPYVRHEVEKVFGIKIK